MRFSYLRVLSLCTLTAKFGSRFIEHISTHKENKACVYAFFPTATTLVAIANKPSYCRMGTKFCCCFYGKKVP